MNSRERVHLALNHQEPDRVPLDLGGSSVTGMHVSTVYNLRQALSLDPPGTPVKAIRPYLMLGEIAPDTERIDREARFPEGIWHRLGELGLLGASVDEAYGGTGLGLLTGVLIVEEMARTCPALALSYAAHANLCADNLNAKKRHQ